MKLPRLLMLIGAAVTVFAVWKIYQAGAGPEEYPPLPWQLRTNRALMDLDYLRRRNGNRYIPILTRLGQARGIA